MCRCCARALKLRPVSRICSRALGEQLPCASYLIPMLFNATECNGLQRKKTLQINAMTTPQFIDWLDDKMAQYTGKLIPPPEVLAGELDERIEVMVRESL